MIKEKKQLKLISLTKSNTICQIFGQIVLILALTLNFADP
jgi:hypothetical protein